MSPLKIPESGLMLKGPAGEGDPPSSLTQQAFAISLEDNVIENMIKCVQGDGSITLALGASPTLHYGSHSHRLSPPSSPSPSSATSDDDEYPQDLYLTQPYHASREGTQIPTMSFFKKFKGNVKTMLRQPDRERAFVDSKKKSASVSSRDSEQDALKDKTTLLSRPLQAGRKAGPPAKKMPWDDHANNGRSLSTSPSLKPTASPNPAEQAKKDRKPLVHELAICDQTTEHLKSKWRGKPEDFKTVLEKIAEMPPGSKKWKMRQRHWRELDVWSYNYDPADREAAIENAKVKYDKSRISPSEPEWDMLLPANERGQGKGAELSKVQKKILSGPAAAASKNPPKISVQKADDGTTANKDDLHVVGDKPKGGESMARTGSNKGKKISSSEAQAKRLLGGKSKASTPKVSPTKGKKPNGNSEKKVLSSEFVYDSDSADSVSVSEASTTARPSNEKPSKAAEKPTANKTDKTTSKGDKAADKIERAAAPKPRPVERETTPKAAPKPAPKATAKAAPKRSMDEDDSSSSSGTPLSKRLKTKGPLPAAAPRQRGAEPRQPQRDYSNYNNNNGRYKNTSPTKSSPLASSPPTNASDISSSDDRHANGNGTKKRRAEEELRAPAAKKVITDELVREAQRFKKFYAKYEDLHFEISAMERPPQKKLDELLDLRDRLKRMKERIYEQHRARA